jgi:prevent-host-death family protein
MASTVNIHEAKTHLSQLLVRVERGEQIVIARSGKPIAVLTAVIPERAPRPRGLGRDSVVIHANFDDPLPEFEDFGG